MGAGPTRWVLSASSSDIYRGRAVYTLPVPCSICLSTRLNTQGAKCLPSSSSSHPPTYFGGWWRLSTPEETGPAKVGWATSVRRPLLGGHERPSEPQKLRGEQEPVSSCPVWIHSLRG